MAGVCCVQLSGIQITDDVMAKFESLQKKHTDWYLIIGIDEKASTVVVEEQLPRSEAYEYKSLKAKLVSRTSPCYVVLDHHFENEEGNKQEKVVFIFWCPESSKIRQKMTYASTKEGLKGRLNGLHKAVQASQESDLDDQLSAANMKK